ncbi:membrane lipoprotein lipid attachment site-containing protein [Maribacter flavus]|uniref:membrane lipoprotein lipid attachment site-containing protein n=1 Tax=Maribacter flavus TaxID=1658664 RepID=UPI0013755579|nr:membrane lipoprotein lipid attachment site-containing protein [Maribacter flavus]
MKKVVFALGLLAVLSACTEEDSNKDYEELNQIQSVDGSKIKRPGSGGGNG